MKLLPSRLIRILVSAIFIFGTYSAIPEVSFKANGNMELFILLLFFWVLVPYPILHTSTRTKREIEKDRKHQEKYFDTMD